MRSRSASAARLHSLSFTSPPLALIPQAQFATAGRATSAMPQPASTGPISTCSPRLGEELQGAEGLWAAAAHLPCSPVETPSSQGHGVADIVRGPDRMGWSDQSRSAAASAGADSESCSRPSSSPDCRSRLSSPPCEQICDDTTGLDSAVPLSLSPAARNASSAVPQMCSPLFTPALSVSFISDSALQQAQYSAEALDLSASPPQSCVLASNSSTGPSQTPDRSRSCSSGEVEGLTSSVACAEPVDAQLMASPGLAAALQCNNGGLFEQVEGGGRCVARTPRSADSALRGVRPGVSHRCVSMSVCGEQVQCSADESRHRSVAPPQSPERTRSHTSGHVAARGAHEKGARHRTPSAVLAARSGGARSQRSLEHKRKASDQPTHEHCRSARLSISATSADKAEARAQADSQSLHVRRAQDVETMPQPCAGGVQDHRRAGSHGTRLTAPKPHARTPVAEKGELCPKPHYIPCSHCMQHCQAKLCQTTHCNAISRIDAAN